MATDENPSASLAEPDPRAPADEVIASLAARYPKAIFVEPELRRPLKVGVFEDLWAALAGTVTPKDLSAAIRSYVGCPEYLRRCTAGAHRINLDGAEWGEVSRDEAIFARIMLAP
jgi:ProP effector